jgi:hypothetical protein
VSVSGGVLGVWGWSFIVVSVGLGLWFWGWGGVSRFTGASLQVVVARSVRDVNVRSRRECPVGNLGRFAMFY